MAYLGIFILAAILTAVFVTGMLYADYLAAQNEGSPPLVLQQMFQLPWRNETFNFLPAWTPFAFFTFIVLLFLGLLSVQALLILSVLGYVFMGALLLLDKIQLNRAPDRKPSLPEHSVPYVSPASARLYGLKGEYKNRKEPCYAQMQIGRSRKSSLRLSDPSVSGLHARIVYANGDWYLQDVNSKNGTFVNGQPIQATKLKHGDRIRIGSSEFEFQTD